MTHTRLLRKASLDPWLGKLREAGSRIVAPRRRSQTIDFAEIRPSGEISRDQVQTTLSPKSAVLPPCEELLAYRFEGKDVKIDDRELMAVPTVLFGLRPCDARGLMSLDAVFSWDYQDRFFLTRRENTTIVALSCSVADEYCFCTSVGGGPGDTQGSDILLTSLNGADYLAEILSPKGQAAVDTATELFMPAPETHKQAFLAEVPKHFALDELVTKLPRVFDRDELWVGQSLRCLGCGTCAFLCPTCACFDIQDEANGRGGSRLRCWDSCGFSLFTLHASLHNPRSSQAPRWRQRVMHKFSYLPERLNVLGCVGCGRCSRSCPADMNLVEHLKSIAETQA